MKERLAMATWPVENDRSRFFPADQAKGAFSLLELLLVVALLVVVTTLYWGRGSGNRERSKLESCQLNLEKIFIALQIYANDSQGYFPLTNGAGSSEEALDKLVPRYTVDTHLFICPGSKDPLPPEGESFGHRKISYAYYMGWKATNTEAALVSDRQVNALSKAAGQPAFSSTGDPPGNNHQNKGGNFLFVDGHVAPSPPNSAFSLALPQSVSLLNPKP